MLRHFNGALCRGRAMYTADGGKGQMTVSNMHPTNHLRCAYAPELVVGRSGETPVATGPPTAQPTNPPTAAGVRARGCPPTYRSVVEKPIRCLPSALGASRRTCADAADTLEEAAHPSPRRLLRRLKPLVLQQRLLHRPPQLILLQGVSEGPLQIRLLALLGLLGHAQLLELGGGHREHGVAGPTPYLGRARWTGVRGTARALDIDPTPPRGRTAARGNTAIGARS
mmetsp:Transcript_143699/g.459826  ORF Transcript_143699/g.459826 Transcript_143699/m.459826 type:complete len:226 (-) Transcript_143699:164-841(-)